MQNSWPKAGRRGWQYAFRQKWEGIQHLVAIYVLDAHTNRACRALTCFLDRCSTIRTAGLRALLEGICQDKRIKGSNLKAKIDGLEVILPNKNIIRNLHHFRFMVNDAVHELAAPKRDELAVAISVIEDLLKASRLRELRRRPHKAGYKTPPKANP